MNSGMGNGSVAAKVDTSTSSTNPTDNSTQPKSMSKVGGSSGGGGSSSGGSGSSGNTTSLLLAIPTYWYPPTSYDSQLTSATNSSLWNHLFNRSATS